MNWIFELFSRLFSAADHSFYLVFDALINGVMEWAKTKQPLVLDTFLEFLFFFVVELLQPLLVGRPVAVKLNQVIDWLFLTVAASLKMFQSLFS
jgi:hypothetical protein